VAFDRRDFEVGDVVELIYMDYIDPLRPGTLGIVLSDQPILPGMLGVIWDTPYEPCEVTILGTMEATDSIKKLTEADKIRLSQEFVTTHTRLFF